MNLNRIYSLASPLVDLLFPGHCTSCGESLKKNLVPFFCPGCWQSIEPFDAPSCPGCGKPFQSSHALTFSPAHRCGDCRAHPFHFDSLISPFRYEGALSQAIRLFKNGKKTALARHLASLVSPYLGQFGECSLLLPVPLFSGRLREREFNQAWLLAREAARMTGIPANPDLLIKTGHTEVQRTLNKKERRKNLKGVFQVTNPDLLRGRNILLMDDVFTTGETLNECARILKKNGARSVYGAVLARTPLRAESGCDKIWKEPNSGF